MVANIEAMRHLAKSVLSCILLSLCSFGSHGLVGGKERLENVTGVVRWASVVTLLSAVYYLQFQVCKRFWQRKRERSPRVLRRNQYKQTQTMTSMDRSSDESGRNSQSRRDFQIDSEDGIDSIELDSLPPTSDEEVWIEGTSVVSNNVYYPELTMSSVWTYVYGWGVLLFVCIYCLAGVNIPSSCWWVMGMIALSFDELISKGVGKWFICSMGLSMCMSVFAVWSGALMDENGNFTGDLMFTKKGNIPLLDFVMGVIFPILTPFIFFSIRSTVRSVTNDVSKLCEFALPFMTVMAVCCLVATSGMCNETCETRRGGLETNLNQLNSNNGTNYVDTFANFVETYNLNVNNAPHNTSNNNTLNILNTRISLNSNVMQYVLISISPFIAFWLIRVLIVAILTGHSTEFITAFILVTSTRYSIAHAMGLWSVLALSGAGSAFVLLLLVKRD